MIRLFLPSEQLAFNQIIITGDNARYLSLVLRVKPGELLAILDGTGYRYVCKVLNVNKKEIALEKVTKEPYSAESPVSIVLAQGIPKGDKMDFIVQKSTELGVAKIIPVITEHSQIRRTDKIQRWRKIALSASRQCGREKVPEIEEPVRFEEILLPISRHQNDTFRGIIFSEEEKKQNLKKILNDFKGTAEITLLIGPEGGFSKDEATSAIQKGFISVSLGPRILRTETAPITALSIIQYELGDMG